MSYFAPLQIRIQFLESQLASTNLVYYKNYNKLRQEPILTFISIIINKKVPSFFKIFSPQITHAIKGTTHQINHQ